MSILKNLSNAELANIVSGNSPNPVADAPPAGGHVRSPSGGRSPLSESSKGSLPGLSAYQQALLTLHQRQLSGKRNVNSRLSIQSTPENSGRFGTPESQATEADRDVVEIDLNDSSGIDMRRADTIYMDEEASGVREDDRHSVALSIDDDERMGDTLQQPVYPGILLNPMTGRNESITSGLHAQTVPVHESTSTPEMTLWENDQRGDYFRRSFYLDGRLK